MLSTVPAFSLAEPGLVNPFSDFQTGFTRLDWDCSDLFSVIKSSLKPAVPDPCSDDSGTGSVRIESGFVYTKTGSDESSADSIKMSSGSGDTPAFHCVPDEMDSEETKNLITGLNSGSTEHNRDRTELTGSVLQVDDERKRKRMESNRESARRSRKRKQYHIENLTNQVNRLELENRELSNRVRIVLYHIRRVCTDNDRLVAEQEILRRRLSELRRVLILRQLQHQQQQWSRDHSSIIMNEQNPSFCIDHIL